MGPYGPRDALRDHVVSLGCSIRRSPDGGGLNVDCPSHEARIALLDDLAWHDARYDGRIAKLAMAIASKVKPDAKGKVDELALAKALHHAVSTRVRYLGEGSERFSKAWHRKLCATRLDSTMPARLPSPIRLVIMPNSGLRNIQPRSRTHSPLPM